MKCTRCGGNAPAGSENHRAATGCVSYLKVRLDDLSDRHRNLQGFVEQNLSDLGARVRKIETRGKAKPARIVRRDVRDTLLDTTCGYCQFDEAEGGVTNHCDACCRRIVTKLWKEEFA